MPNAYNKMEINEEEKDFLIGLLEHTKEDLDMSDSMEYGSVINDILDKLNACKDQNG